jgi:hypothetical protein
MARRTPPPFRADHVGSLAASLSATMRSPRSSSPGRSARTGTWSDEFTARSGVVDEQAADVAAVQHVPVALVDLVE